MELLLLLGVIAVVILVALGIYLFLQQRRNGTVRAVLRPRRGNAETADHADRSSGSEA
jgi:uncharacterized iron-regulated membrane protein